MNPEPPKKVEAEVDEVIGELSPGCPSFDFNRFVLSAKRLWAIDGADDAFQEACIALWEHPTIKQREENEIRKWFFEVLSNKRIDLVRKRKPSTNYATDQPDGEVFQDDGILPPPDILEGEEESRHLQECLAQLSKEDRLNLIYFYYDNKSDEEIANLLSMDQGILRTRRYRARKQLRECIERKRSHHG